MTDADDTPTTPATEPADFVWRRQGSGVEGYLLGELRAKVSPVPKGYLWEAYMAGGLVCDEAKTLDDALACVMRALGLADPVKNKVTFL